MDHVERLVARLLALDEVPAAVNLRETVIAGPIISMQFAKFQALCDEVRLLQEHLDDITQGDGPMTEQNYTDPQQNQQQTLSAQVVALQLRLQQLEDEVQRLQNEIALAQGGVVTYPG